MGGATTVTSGGAHVTGASEIDGTLVVNDNLSVTSGGAHITGGLSLDGLSALTTDGTKVHVNEAGAVEETQFHGTVRFMDKTVFFARPITVPGITPSLEAGPGIMTTVDSDWMTASLDTDYTDALYYRVMGEDRDLVVDANKQLKFGGDAALGAGGGARKLLLVNPDGAYATTRVTGNAHVTGDLYLDDALLLQTSVGDWKKAVSREGAQGTVLALNKDEAFGGTVVYGPADFRGDVTMANMVMANGTFKEDVSVAGTLDVAGDTTFDGDVVVGNLLTVNGDDLAFAPSDRGDGGRAMVHEENDALAINYAGDFSGGTVFSGDVGIGTGDPQRRLYIKNGDASDSGNPIHEANETGLVIEGGASTFLELLGPEDRDLGVVFSRGSAHANERGWVTYDTGSNVMGIGAGGDWRMEVKPDQVFVRASTSVDLAVGATDSGIDYAGGGNFHLTAGDNRIMTVLTDAVRINDPGGISRGTLTVGGGSWQSLGQYGYLVAIGTSTTSSGGGTVGIWAHREVAGQAFLAYSDARIKDVLGPTDGAKDLDTLRRIEVVDYRYKDTVAKGDRVYKKVVAQQVEEVYPRAVTKATDFIPDVYLKSTSTAWDDGRSLLTVTLSKDHGFAKGDKVKLIAEDGSHAVEVVEVPSARSFAVSGFEAEAAEVFVYGKEVDDYRTVDYEAVSMLNVSAVQELARKVELLEARVRELEQGREGVRVRPVSFEVPADEPLCPQAPSSSQAYH